MTRPRVLVVRSGAHPFRTGEDSGPVEIVECVSHSIETVEPAERTVPRPDVAIFTSQISAERVSEDKRLSWIREAVRGAARVVAVGQATAEALRARGIEPGTVAGGSGDDVLERLPADLAGVRVLLPCGDDAGAELAEGLARRGAAVDRVVVYRKVARPLPIDLDGEILSRPFAAFCATSPSAVRWLFDGLSEGAAKALRGTSAVALGAATRRALESAGVDRILVTPEARFEAARHWLEVLATAPAAA